MSEPRHLSWDARVYKEVSDPQREWGRRIIDEIDLRGDESVLDAGCGSGDVTRILAERVPRGRLLAVDGSPEMVALAREHLGDLANVTVRQSDLLQLRVDDPVDLVFSSAVFHWIPDHARLFARIAAAMAPGGRLVAQCGGQGNIATVVEAIGVVSEEDPFAEALAGFRRDFHFAGPEETAARLAAAGLVDVETWLSEAPVRLAVGGPAEMFMTACVLRLHQQCLPEELRVPFAAAVAERIADPEGIATLPYVRLNIRARRPT